MRKSLVFGGTSTDLLASFSQSDINQYSCWKMSQTSFEWADPTLLEVLPQSGMTASGRLYQLHNVEHPISDAGGLQSPSQAPLDTTCETNLLLPTPTVNASKNNPSTPSAWNRHDSLNVEAAKMQGMDKTTGKDFQLNPRFVEEMMGFPIGWTELKHSETQSSHSAQNGSDNKS